MKFDKIYDINDGFLPEDLKHKSLLSNYENRENPFVKPTAFRYFINYFSPIITGFAIYGFSKIFLYENNNEPLKNNAFFNFGAYVAIPILSFQTSFWLKVNDAIYKLSSVDPLFNISVDINETIHILTFNFLRGETMELLEYTSKQYQEAVAEQVSEDPPNF